MTRARVENGRISDETPTGLPDGEIDRYLAEPEPEFEPEPKPKPKPKPKDERSDDELSDDELARLNEALARGFESIKAGRFRPAADVIAELRRG